MEYRAEHAETAEEKAKELAFTGLGLTSRKNLCLNPEVRHVRNNYMSLSSPNICK